MKVRLKFTDMPPDFDQENNCYIRAILRHYTPEFSDNPDFVFFSVFGTEFLKYPDAVKIFLVFEPAYPNFNDCDYAIGSLKITLGNRYFRHPPLMNFGEKELYSLMYERRLPPDLESRKFCNFIYANAAGGRGAKLRVDFCKRLTQYKRVDCPGRVLSNMPEMSLAPRFANKISVTPNWAQEKIKFISNYKFTIAFENTAWPGFSTEKLIHPLLAGSLPIYWGNPDVGEYFNEKAMIFCQDEKEGFSQTIERVKSLDSDPEALLEMLQQPPLKQNYPIHWEDDLTEFLAGIIDRGRCPFDKNPIGFATMSADDFPKRCREGKVGLSTILKTSAQGMSGWLSYKLKIGRNK